MFNFSGDVKEIGHRSVAYEPAMVFAVGWLTGAMPGTRPTHPQKRRSSMLYKAFRRF